MRIKCIGNNLNEIKVSANLRKEVEESLGSYEKHPLTIGECYLVYAILNEKGHQWFSLIDNDHADWDNPLFYSEAFFEVIDDRPSSCWIEGKRKKDESIFSFKEWVEEETFFERLVDGEERELEIFRKYKDLMDLEFSVSSVNEKVNYLGDDWIMCSKCDEAWENTSLLEMVRCPKCRSIYLNQKSPRNAVADKGGLGTDNIQP